MQPDNPCSGRATLADRRWTRDASCQGRKLGSRAVPGIHHLVPMQPWPLPTKCAALRGPRQRGEAPLGVELRCLGQARSHARAFTPCSASFCPGDKLDLSGNCSQASSITRRCAWHNPYLSGDGGHWRARDFARIEPNSLELGASRLGQPVPAITISGNALACGALNLRRSWRATGENSGANSAFQRMAPGCICSSRQTQRRDTEVKGIANNFNEVGQDLFGLSKDWKRQRPSLTIMPYRIIRSEHDCGGRAAAPPV